MADIPERPGAMARPVIENSRAALGPRLLTESALLVDSVQAPQRPVLIIDERRFGADQGFAEERIVFAGVLVPAGALTLLGLEMEKLRNSLDAQKRTRAIKAPAVFKGRLANRLRCALAPALALADISYWAASQPFLAAEKRISVRPTVVDAATGRSLDAPEMPMVQIHQRPRC